MCLLSAVGELDADRLVTALAEIFRAAPEEVEVVDEGDDPEGRNWNALVHCDRSALRGHISWFLDVYVQKQVAERPSGAEVARRLAGRLWRVVLYPADGVRPSAYWLVTPEGLVTRARLYESDDEEPVYTIDAVEDPVPHLPDVRVELIREVIREQPDPTPVSGEFSASAEACPGTGDALWCAMDSLGAWEKSVYRVESDWPPRGRYPADTYAEDLEIRDEIGGMLPALPQELGDLLRCSAERVDERFRDATRDDGGQALSAALGISRIALADKGWWWHRRPVRLSWEGL
ncbi:hypothetical protein V1L54_14085 [Streptomyces sp. TRM 70361]|uniref:hypothetical protein n=1 Tax=Streptomyces sp. TRM 70361 TaxID=3116553 RepID=UPI002E7ADA25|nr:hypothetical protein [Streptomyces sp. TRM 70361]MEE1940521.1 hypothetical protein [Streptomyces sp. TRM 70361]